MVSHLLFYQLLLLGLLWLCCMLHAAWPSRHAAGVPRPPERLPPSRKRPRVPKPFPGLTHKPRCEACVQAIVPRPQPPGCPPPRLVPTRGRPRQVDTSSHFCPQPYCASRGWVGLGNLRAHGPPSGGPWRQLHCTACESYFLETHGTPFHGKRVAPDVLVWAVGALAAGLGIRAVARVFEVDPNTGLQWLIEVADHAAAFSQYFLHDLRVTQVQLDELFALLSAVKAGEVSETEAIQRLARSPQWVWAAIDPVSKVLLALDSGDRTLAMAQRLVHQVVQVLAPDCVPLFLTDGFKEYATALLSHFGQWVQPPRRQAQGPAPKPRWMPRPQLLYAQVVKTVRRRRLAMCSTAWCLAPWRPSITSSPHWGGTLTPPLWSGSTSASGSMSPRSGDASAPSAKVRTAYVSNWPCTMSTIISACPMPVYASHCHSRSRPTVRARPRCGGRVHRRWRRG